MFGMQRLLITLVAIAGLAAANDSWPQWRGPNLDGTSTSTGLPVRWSTSENVVWRTKLPSWAAATPIIWGDTVFVTSAEKGSSLNRPNSRLFQGGDADRDQLYLIAISRQDGKVRWQQSIGRGNRIGNKQNMASPSPVTDGEHVWVANGNGEVRCFDFSGRQIWLRDLQADYGKFGVQFGYGSSPLLHQGVLYLQNLQGMYTDDPSYVLAMDAKSGKTLWKVDRPTDGEHETPDSYSTATLAKVGEKFILIVSGAGYVTGHDLQTGREVWRAGGLNPNNARNYRTIASSLVVDDIVLVPSRRRPFIAFRTDGRGDVTESKKLWSTDYGPDVPTPTSDGKRLYIIDDKGISLNLKVSDGSTIWDRTRIEPGTYSASPLLADGKIYAISEEGTTTVLKAGDEFEILAVNRLDDYTLASPAAAGNQIFIRTAEYLYCIGKP
ncbi:MAG: PQQ-binding-like beta-propeller repeat protein [Acidobacteriia bacterium]|nr:PQQ-binding-like beta-propeller repeat protein [Terriglobia bacterium]MYK11794.1 PQQ-binding-like beta-propeller repeat protein [Terriglobia bacterium]